MGEGRRLKGECLGFRLRAAGGGLRVECCR